MTDVNDNNNGRESAHNEEIDMVVFLPVLVRCFILDMGLDGGRWPC